MTKSGEEYWCSNNTSPSSLQKTILHKYNLRSNEKKNHNKSSTKSTKSLHTFSHVSKKRAKRRRVTNRLRRGGKNYGVGRLFKQKDNLTGQCSLHIMRRREYSAEDCTNPNGIDGIFTPPSATNNDGSVTCCIDNINVVSPLELYEQIKVVEMNIPGRKYNVAALSRDNGFTWRFVCILYVHPELVLYSHCRYDSNQKLVLEKEIHSVNMIELYNKPPIEVSLDEDSGILSTHYNTFDVYYVNKITPESNADDGFVECNVNRGPDKIHSNDVSPEHNAAVDKAIRDESIIIQQLKNKNGNFTNNMFTTNFNTSKQKEMKSLVGRNRQTTFESVLDLSDVPNRGVAIPLPPSAGDYTTIETCFVPPGSLSKLYEISSNEDQQIERESFIKKVRELSTTTQTINVSSVPFEGLVLEESSNSDFVGTTDKSRFSRREPRERAGGIIAQWVKTREGILINVPLLIWAFDFTFGSPSHSTCCKRRVTSNFGKINKYFGRTRSSQPNARPRTGKESVYLSNRWVETAIRSPLFIPMMNRMIDLLTAEANMFSKGADVDLYNFYTEVFKQAKGGEQLACNNRPAYGVNDMGLFTLEFFCTEHADANDSFGSTFSSRGFNYANSALHHCLGDESSSQLKKTQSVETLLHILRQGRQSTNGEHNWRLPATCGYQVSFSPGKDKNRKACVLFLYNSIARAVKIPLNRRSYQTWDTSLRHQTMMPYTYNDDHVYLNDENLSVLGWGCGKGRKRVFLEERLPANEIPNGPIQATAFINIVGPRQHLHEPAIAEGLTTQQQITDWLHANPLI